MLIKDPSLQRKLQKLGVIPQLVSLLKKEQSDEISFLLLIILSYSIIYYYNQSLTCLVNKGPLFGCTYYACNE